ncbi:hypothetical protein DL769_003456 [Monosporascus sp. CRB-8-3]|nr:hypothetical protein DL769_003456 [Monosporascus sp. CRB-8-3]
MAPYTMKINIRNDLGDEVAYIGAVRLKGDGYVCSTGKNIASGSTDEGASLKKGDGTEGLFIATLFSIPGCASNLLVWSSMSAASGGEVMVRVAFVDADKSVTSLPDDCYYSPGTLRLTDGEAQAEGIDAGNGTFRAKVEEYDGKYPDSTCTVSVGCFLTYHPQRVY